MTELRQAAKMALEELEMQVESQSGVYIAINALRQALAQPTREWVGMTDKEIQEMANDLEEGYVFLYRSFAAAIEAKLKEKNT